MDVLLRNIRQDFEARFAAAPTRDETEAFVQRAFAKRNVRPTPALLQHTIDHLLHGAAVPHLKALNLNHYKAIEPDEAGRFLRGPSPSDERR